MTYQVYLSEKAQRDLGCVSMFSVCSGNRIFSRRTEHPCWAWASSRIRTEANSSGMAERGVECLGYRLTRTGITVARASAADQAKLEVKAEWREYGFP